MTGRVSALRRAGQLAQALAGGLNTVVAGALIALVRAYQLLLSPLTGPSCRFYPSCSTYAVTALRRHGPIRGLWLTGRRLLRCNPWNAGGVDDVPSTGAADRRHGHHEDNQCGEIDRRARTVVQGR